MVMAIRGQSDEVRREGELLERGQWRVGWLTRFVLFGNYLGRELAP